MSDKGGPGQEHEPSIEVADEGLPPLRKKRKEISNPPYSEADLLAGMTRLTAHADELPSLLAHDGESEHPVINNNSKLQDDHDFQG